VSSVAGLREFLGNVRLTHPLYLALLEKTVIAGVRRAGFPEE
jgi:hypothetical protein